MEILTAYWVTWKIPAAPSVQRGIVWLTPTTTRKIQDAKTSPKIRHLPTIAHLCRLISSQRRHLLTITKNVVNSNIFPTCPITIWGTSAH